MVKSYSNLPENYFHLIVGDVVCAGNQWCNVLHDENTVLQSFYNPTRPIFNRRLEPVRIFYVSAVSKATLFIFLFCAELST